MKYEEKDLSLTEHKSKIGDGFSKPVPFFMLLLEIFFVQIISNIAKGYTAHDE